MPDDTTVKIPVGGSGENEMEIETGDIDQDCAELLLEDLMEGHGALTEETVANAETAHSIVRFSGARKFNREDPMEAAAAEVMLRKKP